MTGDLHGSVRLPTDRRRVPGRPCAPASVQEEFPPGAPRPPDGTGDDAALLLAAFVALLGRYTAQEPIALAVRATPPDRAAAPRLLSFDAPPGLPFGDLVAAVAQRLDTDEGAPGTHPGATVAFEVSDSEARPPVAPGGRTPPHELRLHFLRGHQPVLRVDYDANLFATDTIMRLARHYRTLLGGGIADPGLALRSLPMLSDDEVEELLVTWNNTSVPLPHAGLTIPEAFARRAAARPEAVALLEDATPTTYAEAEYAAGALARRLRDLGVARGDLVGVALQPSRALLVALLGVMKAGAAFVPLDPSYPRLRLQAMVGDSGCVAIVTEAGHAGVAGALGPPVLLADEADGQPGPPATRATPVPEPAAGPDDLCYVIYTSGSTGKPKGIALRHAGVLNNLDDLNTRFGVGPGDSVLALSSPSFDMSVYEFLGMTVAGATVVVPARSGAKDPRHWLELVREHGVTLWNSAPSLLDLAVTQAEQADVPLPSLRLALVGGDWIPVTLPERLRKHAPGLCFVSLGGATESSIHSTIYEVVRTDPEWVSIPYGRPMANQRVYVLDAARQPVPIGVAGELHLAGAGLARGYVGDEQRTEARFFEWSYGPVIRERLYRTGDLARYRPDGQLELLGRMDFQVKINGVRVETGEVEAAILAHPSVEACAVAAWDVASGGRQLVAYAVAAPGARIAANELRSHAGTLLPPSMVPVTVVFLDALPLSPNGKVDRRALPAPGPDEAGTGAAAGDGGVLDCWQRRVADVWGQVLGVERLGPDSDFFAVGGDSFSAMRAVQLLDPDLPVAELFGARTLGALAATLRLRDGTVES